MFEAQVKSSQFWGRLCVNMLGRKQLAIAKNIQAH